jgi:hypothetical protein
MASFTITRLETAGGEHGSSQAKASQEYAGRLPSL